eukprot:CAMPEP_0173094320 /NCGR_PEP_ID=MMETSP1102-20130122/30846_1 /TAXON_ID=49646 /ORGANISM="Geminigera sp., Strain Caron Lab Isolate" /LENGTH=192 /DNA_ID=CAMNT_0013983165 /DNA_START=302 /DNA_END=878 /DNA_ORIENTATION=-
MIALRGHMPDQNACLSEEDGWIPKKKAIGPGQRRMRAMYVTAEFETCHNLFDPVRNRGFRGGGPAGRHGHTSLLYQTPQNSDYAGATIMIIFGGKDKDDVFLNDVWVMCVADCMEPTFVYTDTDLEGLPLLVSRCPEDRCRWQEKMISQTWDVWNTFVDDDRAKKLQGHVPSRPAGRSGHTAVLGTVVTEGG